MSLNKHIHLNEIHCDLISEYMQFCKYQLGQRLKSIDYCFTSLLNCRVRSSETYTGDEVKSILIELQDVVRGEVEVELTDGVQTNTLFVQQLLSQAEEWHLTLSGNISELENRDKIQAIKLFEEQNKQKLQDPQKINITVTQAKQIIPVEDMNVASALKREIAKLTVENDFLKAKLNEAELQLQQTPGTPADEVQNGHSSSKIVQLQSQLLLANERIQVLTSQLSDPPDSVEKLHIVQQAVDTLSKELEANRSKAEEQTEKLRHDLEAREDKLRQVQTNLLLAEKELDKKFQATSAYTNMKTILMQKNTQIKNLRRKLKVVGLQEEQGQEDEEKEDEDKEGGRSDINSADIATNDSEVDEGFRI